MSPNAERRPVTSEAASQKVFRAASTTVAPASDDELPPHRRRCRVKRCRETIPYALGYAPDWTCWRHHRLVVPPLEPVEVGRG